MSAAQIDSLLAEGDQCWGTGAFAAAEAAYGAARKLAPDNLRACFAHAATLKRLDRLAEAEAAYRIVMAARPDHGPTLGNLAVILFETDRAGEGLALMRRASALPDAGGDALANLGAALLAVGETAEAAAALERASTLAPHDPATWRRLGSARRALKALDGAIAALRQALALDPEDADARLELGNALFDAGRAEEAEAAYRELLLRYPEDAGVQYGLGVALDAQGRLPEAISAWGKARACDPGLARAAVRQIHARMQISDWSALADYAAAADTLGIMGEAVSPGAFLALDDDPERHRALAEAYAMRFADIVAAPLPAHADPAERRIRVGYFSADFHDHATMHLMAGLFRSHDHSRFQISAWSYGRTREGAQRAALIGHVDHFIDVADWSDVAVADHARAHRLDIAVDLKGYTEDNRIALFAHRLAPVQVSYLGYPGTCGAPFLDYIIGDPVVIPPEAGVHYHERVIRLPGCYQPNDDRRAIAPTTPPRTALGLPERGFVFACFNNTYKITPREWDIWMRLLGAVDGSVLWLLQTNRWAEANLLREAEARGVDPARIRFAPWAPHSEHLARLRAADLFLDCFVYNAHTTASDALWAGLPVLTRPGRAFAARVAASLVNAVGLPELSVESDAAYEALALALARDPARLADLRARLAANRKTAPLFDTERHTRALEAAYVAVHQRCLAGLPPTDIAIG